MGYKNVLVGVVGEHLALTRLQALGWQVPDGDFLGGNKKDLDLVATSPDGAVVVEFQVKTNTSGGKVHWAKPGRAEVDPWIARAAAAGRLAAFILIEAGEESVWIEPDPQRHGYFFPEPEILQMTALTAQDFGDLVDRERAAYGQRRRQRLSRGGKGVIGELLSPDDLRYPVDAGDGKPLQEFLARMWQRPAASADSRLPAVG
jgi:hypothetical protein